MKLSIDTNISNGYVKFGLITGNFTHSAINYITPVNNGSELSSAGVADQDCVYINTAFSTYNVGEIYVYNLSGTSWSLLTIYEGNKFIVKTSNLTNFKYILNGVEFTSTLPPNSIIEYWDIANHKFLSSSLWRYIVPEESMYVTITGASNFTGTTVTATTQSSTTTLTGTSGTANITINGTAYLATFATSLTQTATNFVTSNKVALAALGIAVTSSGAGIIFSATTGYVPFTISNAVNASGNLAGTTVTTETQVSTVTLTGSGGTANIKVNGSDYLSTWNTDANTTAADFVTAYATALNGVGITVTSSGPSIIFSSSTLFTITDAIKPSHIERYKNGAWATWTYSSSDINNSLYLTCKIYSVHQDIDNTQTVYISRESKYKQYHVLYFKVTDVVDFDSTYSSNTTTFLNALAKALGGVS